MWLKVVEVHCDVSTAVTVLLGVWPSAFIQGEVSAAISQENVKRLKIPSRFMEMPISFSNTSWPPAHTAKGTRTDFNGCDFTVLNWPENCPDLNYTEEETPEPTMADIFFLNKRLFLSKWIVYNRNN